MPDTASNGAGKSETSEFLYEPTLPTGPRPLTDTLLKTAVCICLLSILLVLSRHNFLMFHAAAELFSIAVAWSVFILVWNSRAYIANGALVFIGISYLFIGVIDFFHTLAYKGMGVLSAAWGADPPTQLWIAARYLESISLCIFPLLFFRRLRAYATVAIYAAATALVLLAVFYWKIFPRCYVEGVGLTAFKKTSEYVICFALLVSLALLYRKRELLEGRVYRLMSAAVVLTIMAELSFTFYVSVYGISNLVGHYFKILSFFLVYLALVRSGLKMPFAVLFRDLKQHQKALEESNHFLDQTGRLARVGGWEMDAARRVKWTPETYRIHEVPQTSEPSLEEALDFFHPDDRQALEAAIEKALASGEPYDLEIRFITAGGKHLWVRTVCQPEVVDGKTVRLKGVFQDITAQRQAREALLQSEEKLRVVVDTMHSGLVMVEAGGHIVFANRRMAEMLGCPLDEVIGSLYLSHTHGSQEAEARKKMRQLMKGDIDNVSLERLYRRNDGTTFWGHLSGKRLHDRDGGFRALVGVIHDVSDRKAAEAALRESENRFRGFAEQSMVGMYLIEGRGFRYVNPKFAEIFGYRVEECLDRMPFERLVHPDDRAMVEEQIRRRLSGEATAVQYAFRGVRKSGEVIHVEIYGSFIELEGRRAVTGTLLDITGRIRAEEEKKRLVLQLQQAQRLEAIGTLAGGIAHDFNNILSAIIGFTELSLDDAPDGSVLQDNLKEVLVAGKRARDLVRRILTFSGMGGEGKGSIQLVPLVQETLRMMNATIPATIRLEEDLSRHPLTITANGSQINQVLLNLITNAAHAINGRGHIQVTLDTVDADAFSGASCPDPAPGKYARLTVSDTGSGIAEKDIARIFDPYFTTKPVDKGSGLGLAVVHGIVKDHGGHITVDSQVGRGTTISVLLPLVETAPPVAVSARKEGPGGCERIMLIDDEAAIVRFQKMFLERRGYRVAAYSCGADALAAFRARPDEVDLVVTDMTMPDITGDALAREVKAVRPDLPVILCTGFSEKINEHSIADLPLDGWFMKPVDGGKLTQKIRELLNRPA